MPETAMVQTNGVPQGLLFTSEQRKMIRDSFARGASETEFAVLMEVARLRNLNPVLRQIHFVKRKTWNDASGTYTESWSYQVSIDGLRATAERTGRYDGQDEPEFEYDKDSKQLRFARVRVYKKGIARPFVGIAHWSEYVQTKKDGSPTKMWAEKQHIMLAKCAEALGLRKAFPEETSGMYTEEEMAKATPAEEDKTAAPVAKQLAAKKAIQVIEVQPEKSAEPAPEEPPPPTEQAAPVDPQEVTAADLIDACEAGFDHEAHKTNWRAKHRDAINALAVPLKKAVVAAFDKAQVRA